MGKGSAPRPFSVSNEEYNTRWDAIFGRDVAPDDTSQERVDEIEKNEHVDEPLCPDCRAHLERKLDHIRSDYERDIVVRSWVWRCSECNYVGATEEEEG